MPPREEPLPQTDEEGQIQIPGGDSIDPDQFADLESKLIEHDEGEEGWRNRLGVDEDDPITPFSTRGSFTIKEVAGTRHAERSRQARTADESFNAPVAPDYATWRANPNRYDLPGVDTIPEGRMRGRAKTILDLAQSADIVHEVKSIGPGSKSLGTFTQGPKEVAIKSEESLKERNQPGDWPGPILAHEVGHAVDYHVFTERLSDKDFTPEEKEKIESGPTHKGIPDTWYQSQLDLEAGEPLHEQAVRLSERKRGTISKYEGEHREYREGAEELMADAFALAVVEPRAARREAPDLIGHIEDVYLAELEAAD